MQITLHSSDDRERISVLGRLDTESERAQLIYLLDRADQQRHYQIDFYDADTLPLDIISAMSRCLDRAISLHIITYHYLLTHQLMRLNFSVQPVNVATKVKADRGRFHAVALAGSTNSLDKILQIIEDLPSGHISVFIAQHILENQVNLLDRLLKARTDYKVVMPQNLVPVEAGTIYIAPPGHHMKVSNGLVYLTRDRSIQYARPSIDVLFESLASEYREQIMAVLLCGFGRDGVQGCQALKDAGACVIIEHGDDCGSASILPNAAIEAGKFDHVAKLPVISSLTSATVATDDNVLSEHQLSLFVAALFDHYGYDFRGYQTDSLRRRSLNLMQKFGYTTLVEFQRAIFSDLALFNRLIAEISVGVSHFFRHPEQFRIMRDKVLPYLESFPVIKLWSAGCATGEEPYSLAILLDELGLTKRCRLFATDFNAYLIDIAKTGLFPIESLETSQSNYSNSGGMADFDRYLDKNAR